MSFGAGEERFDLIWEEAVHYAEVHQGDGGIEEVEEEDVEKPGVDRGVKVDRVLPLRGAVGVVECSRLGLARGFGLRGGSVGDGDAPVGVSVGAASGASRRSGVSVAGAEMNGKSASLILSVDILCPPIRGPRCAFVRTKWSWKRPLEEGSTG